MPHIIVKMYPDRSGLEKREMADRLAWLLHESMGYKLGNVSVSVEEIAPSAWMDEVYAPDIAGREDLLIKRPEYGPLAASAD